MDMAVTNLILPDREKMIDSLDLFAEKMRQWEMIEDLNAISTASIPVIKATVDLNLLRNKEMNNERPQQDTGKNDFGTTQSATGQRKEERKITKIPDDMAELKIDITFDDNMGVGVSEETNDVFENQSDLYNTASNLPKTHQGLASCRLIKNYVEQYKCLKEVSIILKQFLAEMDLNSPYHGK